MKKKKIITWILSLVTASASICMVSAQPQEKLTQIMGDQIKNNLNNEISAPAARTEVEEEPKGDVQEGLYVVPGTQDYLFIKETEGTISFHAKWKNAGEIKSSAVFFKENKYSFQNGDDEKGDSISGNLIFEDKKASLVFNEDWFLPRKTKYIWLRDAMWEFSNEQLEEISRELGVPDSLNVSYIQDEAFYWDEGEKYLSHVHVIYQDREVAGVQADSFTGEMVKEIYTYSSDLQTENSNIDVETEVLDIREDYNEIMQNISNHKYTEGQLSNGAVFYMGEKGLASIVVPKNIDGSEYSRSYYYRDGELFFAYYEGKDAHRFYLTQGRLIRWRYSADAANPQNAINHDRENSQEYLEMEKRLNQDNYALQPYLDEYFGV